MRDKRINSGRVPTIVITRSRGVRKALVLFASTFPATFLTTVPDRLFIDEFFALREAKAEAKLSGEVNFLATQ